MQSIGQSFASSIGGPAGSFFGGILSGIGGLFGGGSKPAPVEITNEPVVHLSDVTSFALGANMASAMITDRWITSQHSLLKLEVGFAPDADGVLTAKVASNLAAGNEFDLAGDYTR